MELNLKLNENRDSKLCFWLTQQEYTALPYIIKLALLKLMDSGYEFDSSVVKGQLITMKNSPGSILTSTGFVKDMKTVNVINGFDYGNDLEQDGVAKDETKQEYGPTVFKATVETRDQRKERLNNKIKGL